MLAHETLSAHLALCTELQELARDERLYLETHQAPPDAALVRRRQTLLNALSASLEQLRQPSVAQLPGDPADRALRAQRLLEARESTAAVMSALADNEKLLLRFSLGPSRPRPLAMATSSQVLKLYQQPR